MAFLSLPRPTVFPREKRDNLDEAQRLFLKQSFRDIDIDVGELDSNRVGPSADQMEWFEEELAGLVAKHWVEITNEKKNAFFAEAELLARNIPRFYSHEKDGGRECVQKRDELAIDDIPSAKDIWCECRRRRWNEERYEAYASQRFVECSQEVSDCAGGWDQLESGLSEPQLNKFMLLFDTLCLEICDFTIDEDRQDVMQALASTVLELRSMAVSKRRKTPHKDPGGECGEEK